MELVVLYLRTKHPESPASTKINACITHAFCDVFCCVLVLVMGLVLLAALATIRPWLIGACGACAIIWGPSSHPVFIYVHCLVDMKTMNPCDRLTLHQTQRQADVTRRTRFGSNLYFCIHYSSLYLHYCVRAPLVVCLLKLVLGLISHFPWARCSGGRGADLPCCLDAVLEDGASCYLP